MTTKSKIVSLSALKRKVAAFRKSGKKIAFTNGCFDLLHIGHVSYLERSTAPKQILIVALNSDRSVQAIKGPKRPIVPEHERAQVIAALGFVDLVTIFDEETPYNVIKAVKPDVLIKGADWKGKEVVGSDVVKENGGRVKLIHYLPEHSSTNIIKTVLAKCKP